MTFKVNPKYDGTPSRALFSTESTTKQKKLGAEQRLAFQRFQLNLPP
jgi:hypothetical protein